MAILSQPPAPFISYISFTVPPLSNLLGTSRSEFLPTPKVLHAFRWVKSIPAMVCCRSGITSSLTDQGKCPHYGECDIDTERDGKTSGSQQLTSTTDDD